jgi:hypothetical protein
MLKLRSIGLSDYAVLEGRQRIGLIRLATEGMPRLALGRHYPPHRRAPPGCQLQATRRRRVPR